MARIENEIVLTGADKIAAEFAKAENAGKKFFDGIKKGAGSASSGPVKDFTKELTHLQDLLNRAGADKSSKAAETFKMLGVSIKDAQGKARPFADVMATVIDKVSQYGNTAQQAMKGTQFFGEGFSKLAPVIQQARENIEGLKGSLAGGGRGGGGGGGVAGAATAAAEGASRLGPAFRAFGLIAAGAAYYATKAMYGLAVSASEVGKALADSAQKANMTTQAYQRMAGASRLAGVKQGEFSSVTEKINNELGKNVTETRRAEEAGKKFGVTIIRGGESSVGAIEKQTDAVKKAGPKIIDVNKALNQSYGELSDWGKKVEKYTKIDLRAFDDTEKAMLAIARAIKSMPDDASKTFIAAELGMSNFLPVLRQGGKGLDDFVKQWNASGRGLSNEHIKQSERFQSALTNLESSWENLKNRFVQPLLPGFSASMEAMALALDNNGSKVSQFGEQLSTMAETAGRDGELIATALEKGLRGDYTGAMTALKELWKNTTTDMGNTWSDLQRLFEKDNDIKAMQRYLPTLKESFRAFTADMGIAWNERVTGFRQGWTDVTTSWDSAWTSLGGIWTRFLDAMWADWNIIATNLSWSAIQARWIENWGLIKAEWDGWLQSLHDGWLAFIEPFVNAWEAVKAKWNEAWTAIKTAWDELIVYFKEKWNSLFISMNGVWDEWSNKARGAIDAVKGWLGGLIDRAKQAASALVGATSKGGNSEGGAPVPAYSHGGPVWGKGTSTSDSIRALLSRGEYVIRARAVSHYGPRLMHMINSMRLSRKDLANGIRGFNLGGMVDDFAMAPAVPRFANGGMVRATAAQSSPTSVVNLSIGNETFPGLIAPAAVAERLVRFANSEHVKSAGRKPGWYE